MRKVVILFSAALLLTSVASVCTAEAPEGKVFSSWQEFFTAIAGSLDMDVTPESIFSLAAESDLTFSTVDPSLILVKANLFTWVDGYPINQLRGASDNGPFFLIKRQEDGLRFLGTMDGNQCDSTALASVEGKTRVVFECTWHMSASSFNVTQYESDGETLKVGESHTVDTQEKTDTAAP